MVTDSNQASTRTHDKLFKLGDADSYNEVVDLLDKYTEQVTRHLPAPMMAMAGVQANQHILDIGTGTGTNPPHGRGSRDIAFAAGLVGGWHHATSQSLPPDAKAAWRGFLAAKAFWT